MTEEGLPKNIRQMGDRDDLYRIYMEDYVDTFIHKQRTKTGLHVGVLVGRNVIIEGDACQFIEGALAADGAVGEDGSIEFTDSLREQLHGEQQAFFPQSEACGWYLVGSEEEVPEILELQKLHHANFPEAGQLLYLNQGEDAAFWSGNGQTLFPVQGYYIYYERNEAMQEYMVRQNQGLRTELVVDDRAARHFRETMQGRSRHRTELRATRALYGVCTVMALVVVVLGVVMFRSYGQMRGLEVSLNRVLGIEASQGTTAAGTETLANGETVPAVHVVFESDGSSEAAGATAEVVPSAAESTKAGQTQIAQTLPPASTEPTSASALQVNGEAGGVHIVREGDTLLQISIAAYGTIDMVTAICEANGIADPDDIMIGQELVMPMR